MSDDTLVRIIREIKEHDRLNPDHGIGCACHDIHAGRLRRLFENEGLYEIKKFTEVDGAPRTFYGASKSLSNLLVVLGYIQKNP